MSQPRFSLWQLLGFAAIVLAVAGGAFLSGLAVGRSWGTGSLRAARHGHDPAPSFTQPRLPDPAPLPSGRPYLGVRYEPVTPALATQEGLTVDEGAWVRRVEAGSPAEAAGLHPGDVLVAVDGVPIGRPHDLKTLVSAHAPGEVVILTIVRGDQTLDVPAALASAGGD
jgi:S1-C subfamily serine protease